MTERLKPVAAAPDTAPAGGEWPPMPRTSAARKKDEPPRTYQVKVTLMETAPPIWRRLIVPGDTTLPRLDRIIQAAMGWTNSHLHTFTVGGVVYGEANPEWEVEDERRVRLADVAREESEAFVYEYDLGDSWRHQVLVEKVIVETGEARDPRCLGGKRACPPEDSGGVGGYYDKLLTLSDPANDEYETTRVWVESMTGGPFDPDAFDLDAANKAIEALRVRRRRG
jgi:hypothetical protein